jgi:DNA-binding MarR family transcriptional regulator
MSKAADRVWNALVAAVMDTRDDYRRRVSALTGLPFGRARALWRLDEPLALNALARVLDIDAPAATVTVNALEERGLVLRTPHPTNGRIKLVSLTPRGRAMVARVKALEERAPASFASLSPRALKALERAVAQIER